MGSSSRQIRLRAAGWATLFASLVAVACFGWGIGDSASAEERRQSDVDHAFAAAADALMRRAPGDWGTALRSSSVTAQRAWHSVYDGLARFPWQDVRIQAIPVEGGGDLYTVKVFGRLKGSDVWPLVAERELLVSWTSGRVTLASDLTPRARRRHYYLAFMRPMVTVRPHLVIIGDRPYRALIARVAAGDGEAATVMRRLRLDPRSAELSHKTTVLVCASRRQAARASASPLVHRSALAFEQSDSLYFIAYTRDEWAGEVKATIRHELTHSFAGDFGQGKHYVGLLVEGLAVAVEGDDTCEELQGELARGHLTLPLMDALTQEDIWEGRTGREVTLAYQEGGTLVSYIVVRWGLDQLNKFAQAVADSDMTPAGIRRVCVETLGVPWRELRSGWQRFVLDQP